MKERVYKELEEPTICKSFLLDIKDAIDDFYAKDFDVIETHKSLWGAMIERYFIMASGQYSVYYAIDFGPYSQKAAFLCTDHERISGQGQFLYEGHSRWLTDTKAQLVVYCAVRAKRLFLCSVTDLRALNNGWQKMFYQERRNRSTRIKEKGSLIPFSLLEPYAISTHDIEFEEPSFSENLKRLLA